MSQFSEIFKEGDLSPGVYSFAQMKGVTSTTLVDFSCRFTWSVTNFDGKSKEKLPSDFKPEGDGSSESAKQTAPHMDYAWRGTSTKPVSEHCQSPSVCAPLIKPTVEQKCNHQIPPPPIYYPAHDNPAYMYPKITPKTFTPVLIYQHPSVASSTGANHRTDFGGDRRTTDHQSIADRGQVPLCDQSCSYLSSGLNSVPGRSNLVKDRNVVGWGPWSPTVSGDGIPSVPWCYRNQTITTRDSFPSISSIPSLPSLNPLTSPSFIGGPSVGEFQTWKYSNARRQNYANNSRPIMCVSDQGANTCLADQRPHMYAPDQRPIMYASDQRPNMFVSDRKPNMHAPEQKPDMNAFDQRPKIYAPEQKTNMNAFEQRPITYPVDQKPSLYSSDQRPNLYASDQRPNLYASYQRPNMYSSDQRTNICRSDPSVSEVIHPEECIQKSPDDTFSDSAKLKFFLDTKYGLCDAADLSSCAESDVSFKTDPGLSLTTDFTLDPNFSDPFLDLLQDPLLTFQTEDCEENKKGRKYKCPYCHVSCANNGQLKGHLRVHTGERPYRCDYPGCGRAFARNEELTRHRRIHSGIRPHTCTRCGKKFGRKDHLNKHQKTHLKTAEKKVHVCPLPGCEQRYTRSDALARHQWGAHGIKSKAAKCRPQVRDSIESAT